MSGSTCESVCLAAHIHVNVGVREWMWLNVLEYTYVTVCANCEWEGFEVAL